MVTRNQALTACRCAPACDWHTLETKGQAEMKPARDLELEQFIYLWHQVQPSYWQKKRLAWLARYYVLQNQVLEILRKLVV